MNEERLERLEPMARVIAEQLARKPEHFITHPSEMKLFQSFADDELHEFAHRHGWCIVRRVGGRRIEFYNAADARQVLARAESA